MLHWTKFKTVWNDWQKQFALFNVCHNEYATSALVCEDFILTKW